MRGLQVHQSLLSLGYDRSDHAFAGVLDRSRSLRATPPPSTRVHGMLLVLNLPQGP